MLHGLINVKSPNNISEWQMGFNSAFKGLILTFGRGEVYDSHPTHASFLDSTGSNIWQNKFVEIDILQRTVNFVLCTRVHHCSSHECCSGV
jgi:hypothetical protein